jgi:hypothetical protein
MKHPVDLTYHASTVSTILDSLIAAKVHTLSLPNTPMSDYILFYIKKAKVGLTTALETGMFEPERIQAEEIAGEIARLFGDKGFFEHEVRLLAKGFINGVNFVEQGDLR